MLNLFTKPHEKNYYMQHQLSQPAPKFEALTRHMQMKDTTELKSDVMMILGTVLVLLGILYALKRYLTSKKEIFPGALLVEMRDLSTQLQKAIDESEQRTQQMSILIEEQEKVIQAALKERALLLALENDSEIQINGSENFLEQRQQQYQSAQALTLIQNKNKRSPFSTSTKDNKLTSIAASPHIPKLGLLGLLGLFASQTSQGSAIFANSMKKLVRRYHVENDSIQKDLLNEKHIAQCSLELIHVAEEELKKNQKNKQKKLK